MKNRILIILTLLLCMTGCMKNNEEKQTDYNGTEIYEGMEFINVSINNNIIKTMFINNSGHTYNGSKFTITIMDENGNVITIVTDEIKDKIETGTTKIIETKTKEDLTNAASIEYSFK